MEEEIENLIEELTKVRPSMLNDEALKLFNTIMAILDERDRLKEGNKELLRLTERQRLIIEKEIERNNELEINSIPKSKIKEKIEELEKEHKEYIQEWEIKDEIQAQIDVLKGLMEDK